jgi:hypothetical protein
MYVQKKAPHRTMLDYEENHRDRLCSSGAAKSIPSVLLLDEQTLMSEGRRVLQLHPNPTRRQGFLLFLFPGARAILPLVVELPQGARSWNGLPLSTKRST